MIKTILRKKIAVIAITILLIQIIFILTGPLFLPYNPNSHELMASYRGPSFQHPFGTDKFGRDVLTRIIFGGRISLMVSILAVMLAFFIGIPYGLICGFHGGKIDVVLSWILNLFMSFPQFFLILTVVAICGTASIWWVILIIGGLGWMDVARIVRNQTLSIKERDFILAEKTLGVSNWRILISHILPNLLASVFVVATLMIGNVILLESTLSFLGLGVQPPTPSWGNIINEGREVLVDAWWITIFPGITIIATVVCLNLIGDVLRDILDPRKMAHR